MRWWRILFILLVSSFTVTGFLGCASLSDYENMKRRAETAEKINTDLRRKLEKLEADYERLKAKLRNSQADKQRISQLQNRIDELKAQLRELAQEPLTDLGELAGLPGVGYNPETEKLYLKSDLLFESGKAVIRESFKKTLRSLAESIQEKYPGRRIYVDGYTDKQKIKYSKDKNPDNWYLGFRRAHAVMRFMMECGIPKERFVLTSKGYLDPIVKGKIKCAENRRVEIGVAASP